MLRPFRSAAITVLIAALGSAQGTTWIVDAAGGGQFTDLPAAEAAAAHGDLLEVRPGLYSPFQTSKGIAVLGQDGVRLRGSPPTFGGGLVVVTALPAGRTFSMRNVLVEYLPFSSGIVLDRNDGRIHLQDVRVQPQPNTYTNGINAALRAVDCDAVTVTACSLVGNSAISTTDTRLVVMGSTIDGIDALQQLGPVIAPAAPGLAALRGSISLARTDVRGGDGLVNFWQQTQPPREAIVATDAAIILAGDSNDGVQAGTLAGSLPLPGILANGGTLQIDPLVAIAGSQGGSPIAGSASVVARRIVSLIASGGTLGGPLNAEIVSPAGDPLALLLSLPIDPIDTSLGTVWFDPLLTITLVQSVQNAGEHFAFAVTFPNLPQLRGLAIVLQAANYYVATARLELSNPAVLVLDR